MGDVFQSVTSAVGNVAEAAVSATGGAIKVVTNTIAGGSTSDALAEVGASANKAYKGTVDISTLGQGDKIDALTGGLYTASMGAGNSAGDLLQGKSVRNDLKDTARTAAVAGASFYGGPSAGIAVNASLSRGGKTNLTLKSILATGAKAAGLGSLANAIDPNPVTPRNRNSNGGGVSGSGYYSDTPDTAINDQGGSFVIPIIIVIVLTSVLLLTKKK